MKAVAFDAYGTLFDVFSVTAVGEALFPGKGDALARRGPRCRAAKRENEGATKIENHQQRIHQYMFADL
jgi:hypothetical protein